MKIYHAGKSIMEKAEIHITEYNKDYYHGFYCTKSPVQAKRWAGRFKKGYMNIYEYTEDNDLNMLKFDKMDDEWLEFIIKCRNDVAHDYDIVEGPMIDDSIHAYVQDYLDGKITREAL